MGAARRDPIRDVTEGWSLRGRRLASLIVLVHLAAVVHAPLTIEGGYDHLLRPLRWLRGYATLLYLDHGYRFFAPDPSPTHTLRVVTEPARAASDGAGHPPRDGSGPAAAGRAGEGDFQSQQWPDRGRTWPRLHYHRWFMLGESVAADAAPAVADFDHSLQVLEDLRRQEAALRSGGRTQEAILANQLRRENEDELHRRQQRLRLLVAALVEHFQSTEEDADRIVRLYSRQQMIPTPAEIRAGRSLDSSDLVEEIELTELDRIWRREAPEETAPPRGPLR